MNDLEKAAREGKIRGIKGMGEKTEKKILESIAFARKGKRELLGIILPEAMELKALLEKR